jgi:hypothetical protein
VPFGRRRESAVETAILQHRWVREALALIDEVPILTAHDQADSLYQ